MTSRTRVSPPEKTSALVPTAQQRRGPGAKTKDFRHAEGSSAGTNLRNAPASTSSRIASMSGAK